MTNEEAAHLALGTLVYVNTLAVIVEERYEAYGDLFFVTQYGTFNASVCTLQPLEGREGRVPERPPPT